MTGRYYLRRRYINAAGYDSCGAYYGAGAPLYCLTTAQGETHMLRASNRAAAIEKAAAIVDKESK